MQEALSMIENSKNNSSKYNVICFGLMPWNNMWKRNQSMMSELSKCDFVNKIIYVNPLFSIRNLLNRRNGNLATSLNNYQKLLPYYVTDNLVVYTPLNILPYKKILNPFKKLGTEIILNIIKRLNADIPYIIFMNCPDIFSNYILDELLKKAELSIFDFSDDFLELGHKNEYNDLLRTNIKKYAKAADIVITVNEHVQRKYAYLNSNIHVLRNATNYNNFDRKDYKPVDCLEKIKKSGKPIIGYSGIANLSRIDSELLDYLISKRPDWQFVFVGPAEPYFTEKYVQSFYTDSKYVQKNNIHIISPVDYELLPDYIRYFDVAIVPFLLNENTRGNDLLKFHDYLAMGKSVVTTNIGGAADLKEVIRVTHSPDDFLNAIEQSLSEKDSHNVLKRKNAALSNSWSNRIKELEQLITARMN